MTKLAEEIRFYSPANQRWFNSLTPLERDTVVNQMMYRSPYDSAEKIMNSSNGGTAKIGDLTGIDSGRYIRNRIASYGMTKDELEAYINRDLSKDFTGKRLKEELAKQQEIKNTLNTFEMLRKYINGSNKAFYAKNKDGVESRMTNAAPKKFNEGINNAFKARDIGSAVGAVGTGLLGGLAANWLARRFTKDNKSNWLTNLATIGATLGAGYLGGKYIGDYAGQNAATKAGFGSEYAMQAPNVNRFADNKAVNYFRNLIG